MRLTILLLFVLFLTYLISEKFRAGLETSFENVVAIEIALKTNYLRTNPNINDRLGREAIFDTKNMAILIQCIYLKENHRGNN